MAHRYRFDLKMFSTVSLAGANVSEARRKVEAAFDAVKIEVLVGGNKLDSSGSRDGSADLLETDRESKAGKVQVRSVFDLMYFGTLEIEAKSADDARSLIRQARLTAIVEIDGNRRRFDTSVDDDLVLLEVDGVDYEDDVSVAPVM